VDHMEVKSHSDPGDGSLGVHSDAVFLHLHST
jgi:hypothetical protein